LYEIYIERSTLPNPPGTNFMTILDTKEILLYIANTFMANQ